jgi:hypothetical protein
MTTWLVLGFIVLIGPLAVLCGVDSRSNEGWKGWPANRS